MLWTVSTIKDSAENVRRFVDRNLSSGADHLLVFLDAPDDEVQQVLDDQDAVTTVVTDDDYWRGERQPVLNRRQRVNANVANTLLAVVDPQGWLFHLDGDECLELDRHLLEGLGPGTDGVRLQSAEAVSSETDDAPRDADRLFKRRLDRDELFLLVALGVLDVPDNGAFFRGHRAGKVGIRPGLDRYLHIHQATRRDSGEDLELHPMADAGVLHYESVSLAEFVRKWSAHSTSGPRTFVRKDRRKVHGAITAIQGNTRLSPGRRRELLEHVYHRWIEDDVATLAELGYARPPRTDLHRYRPRPLPDGVAEDLPRLLATLLEADKVAFLPSEQERYTRLLADASLSVEGRSGSRHGERAADGGDGPG
ncbi:MAG TPA: glycosyltransferase family 2 protein [Segeticoccus sp.]|nr:glycosyltransferase family 2 protein [Segeticoccus sp.]